MNAASHTVALLSDVHGNAVALEAVLRDIGQQGGADDCWFLGDVMGYGPRPLACIHLLCQLPIPDGAWLMGNHDCAGWTLRELGGPCDWDAPAVRRMVPVGNEREIIHRHAIQLGFGLSVEQQARLRAVPTWSGIRLGVFLAHGSVHGGGDAPQNISGPGSYMDDFETAKVSFQSLGGAVPSDNGDPWLLIVGHTHLPTLWRLNHRMTWKWEAEEPSPNADRPQVLGAPGQQLVVINPGSVGQPRDGDPRAAYALLDTDSWTVRFRRVEYEVKLTQAEMLSRPEDVNQRNLIRLALGR